MVFQGGIDEGGMEEEGRVFSGVHNIVLTKCSDIVANGRTLTGHALFMFETTNCCTPYNIKGKGLCHSAYIASNSHSGIKLFF